MTALILTEHSVTWAKKALRKRFPAVKSAHLTEALASAAGYRTHASLLARMESIDKDWPEVALLDEQLFVSRLSELGSPVSDSTSIRHLFDRLGIAALSSSDGGQLDTERRPDQVVFLKTDRLLGKGRKIAVKSARAKAYRNMMVAAVNAGIEQKLFHILPGTNRWPGYSRELTARDDGYTYEFVFAGSIPAIAHVRSASWDELSIHVALWPTPEGRDRVEAMNAGFAAGEAFAGGWLERRVGAYIQTTGGLCCRKTRLDLVASAYIAAKGFGDRGPLHM